MGGAGGGSEELMKECLPFADLVGSDVCVMAAAYPEINLIDGPSVGWCVVS